MKRATQETESHVKQPDDIDKAVDELAERGVRFERYEDSEQDEKGIHCLRPPYRGGVPQYLVIGAILQRRTCSPGGTVRLVRSHHSGP